MATNNGTAKRVRKRKSKGGRPTVMTAETIAKLETAFALGANDREACFYADISQDTLIRYCKAKPEFCERKEGLKLNPILKAKKSVLEGIENNPELALKYLERKCKDEFSLKTEIHETHNLPPPVILGTFAIPETNKPENK